MASKQSFSLLSHRKQRWQQRVLKITLMKRWELVNNLCPGKHFPDVTLYRWMHFTEQGYRDPLL
jgi:hypothetical protein